MKKYLVALVLALAPTLTAAQTECELGRTQVIFSGWAQCTDPEDIDLTMEAEWTSSLQGHVAHGDAAHPNATGDDGYGCLRAGTHTFTLRCEDSGGLSVTETDFGIGGLSVTVLMVNNPPVIVIGPYGVETITPQPGDCLGDDCP